MVVGIASISLCVAGWCHVSKLNHSLDTQIATLNNDISLLEQTAELYKNKPPVTVIETVTEIVTVNNTIETIREVPVEVPVYINNEWREWESLAELTGWVNANTPILMGFDGFEPDCDDYAVRLQQKAYKAGYFISIQVINGGILAGREVSNLTELHAGNLALVGNKYYFIEPQPKSFRIVFVCYRD
jgi:hypothetical protein